MDSLPSVKDVIARRAALRSPNSAPSTQAATESSESAISSSKKIQFSNEASEQFAEKMTIISRREKEEEVGREAATLGIPTMQLKGFPISPDALTLIPEEQARELQVVCFLYSGSEIRVGAIKPQDEKIDELIFALGERHKANVQRYLISAESLEHALRLYAALPKIKAVVKGVEITEGELQKYSAQMTDFASISGILQRASVTDILAVVIAASLKVGSSDIHVEAEEKGIIVRFRVDGILQEIAVLESEQWKKIIARIKLIAGLKINVTDQAQDGRFTIFQKNKQIDVRISTIPTSFGESVVMRLLNPDTISLDFDKLGFRPAALKKIIREIERPNGMIMTTGPTGSGKTTTLYAILKRLNTKDVKIITLEDPVEYKVEGLNQSQIDYSKDYTFAKGLRSILRQDPDIVMVGEIRDLETAEIAIQAALTGHLLLSTIHTNDAAGAIPRFLSMGVAPHLLAPAINAIMGQRLLRRLCEACKQPVTLDEETASAVQVQLSGIPENSGESSVDIGKVTFYGPKGCKQCNESGYKGRVGAYEVLVKDQALEQAILKGSVSEYEMRDIAKIQGMITMTQDGLLKAVDGLTSVEEVKRMVGL